MEVTFKPIGDRGIRVGFGDVVSLKIHQQVRQLCRKLERERHPGIVEWIPSYTAVTVFYQPHKLFYHEMQAILQASIEKMEDEPLPASRVVRIPTCYGGEFGPDIDAVGGELTTEEVVALHSEKEYLVYMLGFAPGFPYLGGLDQRLATPRLAEPRAVTPAGSVGIAGQQTGIYSIETPGGWQIIGRTPLSLYDPYREEPTIFRVGDLVKFEPITRVEYEEIKEVVERGEYTIQCSEGDEEHAGGSQ
ncbi:5-oxoprolinase subunit PxpB [Halalkalibacter urbisdiaboli]|uniref:5-oxoprolinase subunit PxpB n=1 Tax=Halalkalibacter urbisdiaboli TaxID=1960589 RepID=UPI001FD96756|nr:5-oxoprolinase subunit PxpB [Halalkalibacter urbisdiaboli]